MTSVDKGIDRSIPRLHTSSLIRHEFLFPRDWAWNRAINREKGRGGGDRFQLVSNKIEGATLELDLRLLAWSGYTMVSELRLVRAVD